MKQAKHGGRGVTEDQLVAVALQAWRTPPAGIGKPERMRLVVRAVTAAIEADCDDRLELAREGDGT